MRAHDVPRVLPWLVLLAALAAPNLTSCSEEKDEAWVWSGSLASSGSGGAGGVGGSGLDLAASSGTSTPETKCSKAPSIDVDPAPPVPDGVTADFALPIGDVHLAVGPDGDAVVASVSSNEIFVRRYVGGQWADVERIAASEMWGSIGEGSFAIAAGPNGRALVVYAEKFGGQYAVCARTFDLGAGWSDPTLLGVSNEGWWQDPVQPEPAAAMNGKGNAVVIWSGGPDDSSGIFARRFAPGSGFGELETLVEDFGGPAALALHEDDRALAAWFHGEPYAIESRAFDPAVGWGAAEEIDQHAIDPRLSVGLEGSTVALWRRLDSGENAVATAVRPPLGAWSQPTQLDSSADTLVHPKVTATSGFGIGGWSWWSTDIGCYSEANVRILGADGIWQPEIPVPELNKGPAAIRSVSANSAGRAVVAWQRYELTPCRGTGIHLSWFDAATAAWTYEALDPSAGEGSLEAALSPGGRALVGWRHPDAILVRWADPPSAP
jgi:hypothetical protein